MIKINKILALLLSGLIIIVSPRAFKAQNDINLKIENSEQINLCGADRDKRVIITLYIGKILQSDSLFGFNGQLNYNPEKIQFHTALPINTLAEFFEYNRADFNQKGKIIFTASQWMSNIPISGDRPLFAFLGNYIGTCPDTSWVNLDFIEFTDEFKKTIKDVSNGLVKAEILFDENHYLKTYFDTDTLEFLEKDSTKNIQVVFDIKPGLRLSSLQINIENENPNQFEIYDISSLNDYIKIDSIEKIEGKIQLFLSVLNDTIAGVNLKLTIIEKYKSDNIAKLNIEPVKINDCSCISKLLNAYAFMKSNKIDTTPTSIYDDNISYKETKYIIHENYIIVSNENKTIQEIIITNLLGNVIKDFKIENEQQIQINTDILDDGIYFFNIVKKNNNREIKKFIKIK